MKSAHAPAGRAPVIGRRRPDKIGGPADVEAGWSTYPYPTPLGCASREARMGLVDRLGPRGTSPLPVGVRARPWSPMLETLLPAGVWPAWRHGHGGGGPR